MGPKPAQDISPAPAKPAAPNQSNPSLHVELEHNIPIKQPDQPPSPSATPVTPAKQFVEEGSSGDKSLEKVLKEASREVKKMANAPAKKNRFNLKFFLPKKNAVSPEAPASESAKPRPVMAIAAAAVIGLGLVASAIYAFRHQPPSAATPAKKIITTSSSAATNTPTTGVLIKASDISSFASELQSKMDKLNDSQDFNSQDLNDQNLGL